MKKDTSTTTTIKQRERGHWYWFSRVEEDKTTIVNETWKAIIDNNDEISDMND